MILESDLPEFLRGVGDFNRAEALQIGTDGGGVGDDEGGLAVGQGREDIVDAGGHPGVDLAEGLAIGILEIRVVVLAFPEGNVLSGGVARFSLEEAGVGLDGKPEKFGGLEGTQRRRRPDLRNLVEDISPKNSLRSQDAVRRKCGVGATRVRAFRGGVAHKKKCFHGINLLVQ